MTRWNMKGEVAPPTQLLPGQHASLSYAYECPPSGRTVEVVAGPDADGMVSVRLVGTFSVSIDDLEVWGQ